MSENFSIIYDVFAITFGRNVIITLHTHFSFLKNLNTIMFYVVDIILKTK